MVIGSALEQFLFDHRIATRSGFYVFWPSFGHVIMLNSKQYYVTTNWVKWATLVAVFPIDWNEMYYTCSYKRRTPAHCDRSNNGSLHSSVIVLFLMLFVFLFLSSTVSPNIWCPIIVSLIQVWPTVDQWSARTLHKKVHYNIHTTFTSSCDMQMRITTTQAMCYCLQAMCYCLQVHPHCYYICDIIWSILQYLSVKVIHA